MTVCWLQAATFEEVAALDRARTVAVVPLGATEAQLDFPVIYASALNGGASTEVDQVGTDMRPLFDAVLKHVPEPKGDPDAPLQLQICSLDYST